MVVDGSGVGVCVGADKMMETLPLLLFCATDAYVIPFGTADV